MGRLFLAGDGADFYLCEAGFLKPAMQITLGKTEPSVAVEFVSAVELVLQEVENHDLAADFEHFVCGRDGF